jgi:hypothetical protein
VLLSSFTVWQSCVIETRFPPIGDRVEVPGGSIHISDLSAQGRERGVVLLLHGTSANLADMTVALSERLSVRGDRVLSADRPGYGCSDRVAEFPAGQAEKLRRAAEELGATRVTGALARRCSRFVDGSRFSGLSERTGTYETCARVVVFCDSIGFSGDREA